MAPHRVLLLFMSETDLAQMRHLARGLAGEGTFEFFSCALAPGQQIVTPGVPERALDQGRPQHLQEFEAKRGAQQQPRKAGLRDRLIALSQHEPLKSLRVARALARNALYWRRRRREAERFLRDNKIGTVITCNDTTPYYLPVLQAAKTLGLKVILARSANIYYHDSSDGFRHSVKHLMRARMPPMQVSSADSLGGKVINRLVQRHFPEQVADTIHGKLVPYQPADLLSLALAGIRPRQLWYLGQDWTTHIIVSGDDETQALKSYGVPEDRALPIGSVPLQNAHALLQRRDALRDELCRELGLRPDKPIILVTVPAGWEHRTFTREQQFGFLRDLFSILSKFDAQIVLSLHPLSKRSDYEDLAAAFSCKFLNRQLIDSIVIADIFLGADNSSVLRWAMAVGIPTMNFQFNPDKIQFELHPEYPNITDRERLADWLSTQLGSCPIPTAELLKPQRRPMGLIADGRFFQHLARTISVSANGASRTSSLPANG